METSTRWAVGGLQEKPPVFESCDVRLLSTWMLIPLAFNRANRLLRYLATAAARDRPIEELLLCVKVVSPYPVMVTDVPPTISTLWATAAICRRNEAERPEERLANGPTMADWCVVVAYSATQSTSVD